MNLITVILLGIAMWIIYSLMESYNSLSKEVKELKRKYNDVAAGSGSANYEYDLTNKVSKVKGNLLSILQTLLNV